MPRQSREKSGTGIYQMIIRTVPLIVQIMKLLDMNLSMHMIIRKELILQKKMRMEYSWTNTELFNLRIL